MELESDVYPGRLKVLRPVLEQWIALNLDRSGWGRDAPWWYNERASLSQLAGAIWSIDSGWAMEEYSAAKDGGASSHGRVDLALQVGRFTAIAEAKILWPGRVSANRYGDKLSSTMKTAHSRVRDYRTDGWQCRRLGIVFVNPRLPPSVADAVDSHVEAIIKVARSYAESSRWAVAWAFPKGARQLKSKANGRIYPGTIVCIAEAAGA